MSRFALFPNRWQHPRRHFWFKTEQTDVRKRRAQRIDWDNPGDRLKYVPDDILYALPPPARPMYPYTGPELRRREVIQRLPLAFLVLLAIVHMAYKKMNEGHDVQLYLERHAPRLASFLMTIGALRRYPASVPSFAQEDLDRPSLFRRVWLRHRTGQGDGVPVREAVALAIALTGCAVGDARRELGHVVLSHDCAHVGAVPQDAFVEFLERLTRDLSSLRLVLEVGEQLGVWAIHPETERSLHHLYEYVLEQNGGSSLFTVPFLAAIAEEVGLGFEESLAREALTESRAVQLGQVALRPRDWLIEEPPSSIVTRRKKLGEQSGEELARMAEEIVRAHREASGIDIAGSTSFDPSTAGGEDAGGDDGSSAAESQGYRDPGADDESSDEIRDIRLKSRLLVRSHVRVPLEKDEFVNFFALLTATMTHEEVQKYLDVFFLMNSLKGSAGVQPTTVDTAKQLKGADSRVR